MSAPPTILDRLTALYPQARKTTLRQMVASKRVRLNGAPVKSLKQAVADSDTFEVTDSAAAPANSTLLAQGLKILHMAPQFLIVDKPSGLLTATDASEKRPTVLKILTAYLGAKNSKNQVHLVHRLDRDASGLLVLARTTEALRQLKEQFREHTITRRYDALVHGIPAPGSAPSVRLENFLLEDPRTGVVKTTNNEKIGKLAILDFVTIQTTPARKIAHLQCTLYTGRKHQIRVQLKALGHPVLGDKVYGTEAEPPGRLALHASHLTFKHPGSRREVSFDSQMPGTFAHLMRTG